MKKIISVLLCVLLIIAVTSTVFAVFDFDIDISADVNSASVGDEVTLTVSLSGTESSRSGSIDVSLGSDLELVSGEMLSVGAAMKSFDLSKGKGVAAYSSAASFDGDFARIVVRVTGDADRDVSVTVKLNPSGFEETAVYTINEPAAIVTVSSCVSSVGDDIVLDVTLSGAPGIKSLAVSDITYDTDALELTNAVWEVGNTLISSWDPATGKGVAALQQETDINGVILSLEFSVKDEADAGEYPVSLTVIAKDGSAQIIDLSFVPGTVTVETLALLGDVNGDGVVSSKDIRSLKQYLASLIFDNDIVLINADVNQDGDITSKDIRALKQLLTA
ncbi:MAG: dockerin type I repeat-containing protein [Clostridia bacterium]|nr:dockerin type I repeat-containing protein [Clostridia bacterium]